VLPYNLGNINITNRGRTERVSALLRSSWGLKLRALETLVVGIRIASLLAKQANLNVA
jgi:hypothetical protein